MGFATQVQKETSPCIAGSDVIGQARTGSGKTAAFGLPTMNACQPTGELQALILAPTRNLQIKSLKNYQTFRAKRLNIQTVYGGTDLEKQAKTLQAGVDIIVGTLKSHGYD